MPAAAAAAAAVRGRRHLVGLVPFPSSFSPVASASSSSSSSLSPPPRGRGREEGEREENGWGEKEELETGCVRGWPAGAKKQRGRPGDGGLFGEGTPDGGCAGRKEEIRPRLYPLFLCDETFFLFLYNIWNSGWI